MTLLSDIEEYDFRGYVDGMADELGANIVKGQDCHGHGRWEAEYRAVLKRGTEYVEVSWAEGLTEYQDDPEFDLAAWEVEPVTKSIIDYVRTSDPDHIQQT